jgi:hypothetical protein
MAGGVDEVPRGESVYAIPGTYTWVAPDGVTSVSVVVVGGGSASGNGGGLAYKNNISVTPGSSYTVVVGEGGMPGVSIAGGESYFSTTGTVRASGGGSTSSGGTNTAGDGGGTGGTRSGGYLSAGGGGGAGGYSGNGGNGGYAGPAPAGYSPTAGTARRWRRLRRFSCTIWRWCAGVGLYGQRL